MRRVGRDAQHVDRHHRPLLWHAEADLALVASLARAVARLDHIARIAERNAKIAACKVVDVLGRMELADIGPDFSERSESLVQIAEVAALRVETQIGERRRKHLLWGVEQRDAAGGELLRI